MQSQITILDRLVKKTYHWGMGRPRLFDTALVLSQAREAFIANGYNGTSIDDLLRFTHLQRASLYQAFGSKRGLFIATLQASTVPDIDLLLVALMDLSTFDAEVRSITEAQVITLGADAERVLGRQLLKRATIYK